MSICSLPSSDIHIYIYIHQICLYLVRYLYLPFSHHLSANSSRQIPKIHPFFFPHIFFFFFPFLFSFPFLFYYQKKKFKPVLVYFVCVCLCPLVSSCFIPQQQQRIKGVTGDGRRGLSRYL
ncbi:hypothetical protein F5X96DRAFT_628049 [Biscogniauxia mediterranea]|nr:hypothetical protein F5X96DRAFT_628049 [Biscogniauxia mediterranea]